MWSLFQGALRRLIAGWALAFFAFLIQRLIRRLMTPPPSPERQAPSSVQGRPAPKANAAGQSPFPYARTPVRDTLWQGMSRDDLLSTYGLPLSRLSRPAGGEIWIYQRPGNDDSAPEAAEMRVTLENGKVSGWAE